MSAVIQIQFTRQPTRLPLSGGADIVPFFIKRGPILCVSRSDTGREYWTGFLKNADEEMLRSIYTCIDQVESGECEYQDEDGHCECEPLYMGSVYLGTQVDLDHATEGSAHSSHCLAARCKELDLGDYL